MSSVKIDLGLSTGKPRSEFEDLCHSILLDDQPLRYRYTDRFYPLVPMLARRKKGSGRPRYVYVNITARMLHVERVLHEANCLAMSAFGETFARMRQVSGQFMPL